MPDREVKTIKDLLFYQYAKIITKRALAGGDGSLAKKEHYGFIKKTFRELKSSAMSWSDIMREDWQLVESDKECIYCGSPRNLQREHIVPRSLKIKSECGECDAIQSIHNQVWACKQCNSLKSTMGLYSFFKKKYPDNKKYYDLIPPLLEKKYLKTIYCCHECADTLSKGDLDGDGEPTVLDIDFVIDKFC
ncbi:MAG: HNH endonuclease [Spirochaetes bacterium RBG_16_49_21]|nr:MAG: HNH endonuclease [Spirochaetes bacterium RBG_16_49_21]